MTLLKTHLAKLAETSEKIASARVIARAIIDGRQREKMAGGKFFALLEDEEASDERLDALAETLLERRASLEARAKQAVGIKHTRLAAAEDYLDRLEGKVKAVEDSNKDRATNGGPTVEGSADLPKPSVAPVSTVTTLESKDAEPLHSVLKPERAPSDYSVTNGLGSPGAHK